MQILDFYAQIEHSVRSASKTISLLASTQVGQYCIVPLELYRPFARKCHRPTETPEILKLELL